jgi:ABC-type proline/glycine betaine transport system ATPase subunit
VRNPDGHRPEQPNAIAFGDVSMRCGANGTGTVKNPSLTVGLGEFLMLAGESGCGKTSTLNMISLLIVPGAGTIRPEAMDIGAPEVARLHRRIS